MVYDIAERKPVEDDAQDFEYYCDLFQVPPEKRLGINPRDLPSYPAQARILIELGNQMLVNYGVLQNTHGMGPREQAELASKTRSQMTSANDQLSTVAGKKRKR